MDAFPATITARFIISTNAPLRWPCDEALARRQRNALLTFPCRFTDCTEAEGEQRPIKRGIMSGLMEESSGILNLALAGLARLRERGKLRDLHAENVYMQDVVESDPVFDFLHGHLRSIEGGITIPVNNIYNNLKAWWDEQFKVGRVAGRPPHRYNKFSAMITNYVRTHMKHSHLTKDNSAQHKDVVTNCVLAAPRPEGEE
jgi:phage/plasmid-associated DNA primase